MSYKNEKIIHTSFHNGRLVSTTEDGSIIVNKLLISFEGCIMQVIAYYTAEEINSNIEHFLKGCEKGSPDLTEEERQLFEELEKEE